MHINTVVTSTLQKALQANGFSDRHSAVMQILRLRPSPRLYAATFEHEETIVAMGRIRTEVSRECEDLAYAEVPLGIITKGKVIVFLNGKAVRHLTAGDFIGLFETAHFLHFGSKKRLGNWTLIADGDTAITFFGGEIFHRARTGPKKAFAQHLVELSKNDLVPKPLTHLPLLDMFAHTANIPLKEDVLVIAHTHILESTYPLFRHLAAIVGSQHVFVLEKPYSTIPATADKVIEAGIDVTRVPLKNGLAYEFSVGDSVKILWGKVLAQTKKAAISKIIILDDGAEVLSTIPWNDLVDIDVVGVEQTTRGITRLNEGYGIYPSVINVAGSALKKEIESGFIAEAITQEILHQQPRTSGKRIGVVGTGNIGKRIITAFHHADVPVTYYDMSRFNSMGSSRRGGLTSLSEVVEKNDVIIGATGKDFLRGVVLDKAHGEKWLFSASSADIEFYSLLNRAGFPSHAFGTVRFSPHPQATLCIANGGYPINFNRTRELECAEDMQLTRTLLYAGFVQALALPKQKTACIVKLDTVFQREILNTWIGLASPTNRGGLALSTRQIERASEGEVVHTETGNKTYALHETTSPYLDMVRTHTKPYTTRVFGKDLLVYPQVMSPKYDWAGIFGVETLPDVRGKTVLEIGCGSGIISLFAALRGAAKVDAVDINPHAIRNTNANFKKHGVKNGNAFASDLFSNVKESYDLVIFNLPYHGNKPQDILEHGVADEGYKMMKRFIAALPKHMNEGGLADIGFSTSGDTKLLLEQFKKNGLEIVEKYSDERYGYNCDAYILRKKGE